MKNKKLIFSDVDGTLLTAKTGFTDTLVSAMKLCDDNNIEFIMCSGRPTANLVIESKLLRNRGVNLNYVAGFNGAELYDLNNDEVLYSHGLNIDDVCIITDTLDAVGLDYIIYDGDVIETNQPESEWAIHEAKITKLEMREITELHESVKVLGVSDPSITEFKVLELQHKLPEYTIINSTPFFIEITKKNVNKGAGLKSTCEFLNISETDCVCFGDAGNDLAMFYTNAYKVAVDNAIEEIKKESDLIIDSVFNDGVANYIMDCLK